MHNIKLQHNVSSKTSQTCLDLCCVCTVCILCLINRQSPSGNDFIENTKQRMWLKLSLEDVEIVEGKLIFLINLTLPYFIYRMTYFQFIDCITTDK